MGLEDKYVELLIFQSKETALTVIMLTELTDIYCVTYMTSVVLNALHVETHFMRLALFLTQVPITLVGVVVMGVLVLEVCEIQNLRNIVLAHF